MNDNFRDNYDLPRLFFSSASKKWSFCSFVCCCRESRKDMYALVMIDVRSNEEDQLVDPESKWFFRYVFGICIWRERYHLPPPFPPYLAIRHLFTCCVTFQITQKVVQSRRYNYAIIIEITKLIYTLAVKSLSFCFYKLKMKLRKVESKSKKI